MSNFSFHFKKLGSTELNIPYFCIFHFFIIYISGEGEINYISKSLVPASSKQLLYYTFLPKVYFLKTH